MKALLIFSLFLLTQTAVKGEGVDYSQFPLITFVQFEKFPEIRDNQPKKMKHSYVDLESHPFSFEVNFTGGIRPISKAKLGFMKQVGKTMKQESFFERYREEVQVAEGPLEYWIPIQVSVMSFFKKEIPKGGPVRIYARYVGTVDRDRVFAMIEFEGSVSVPEIAKKPR